MKHNKLLGVLLASVALVACNGSSDNANSTTTTKAVTTTASQTLSVPDGTWVGAYDANWSYWRAPQGQVKHIDEFGIKAPSYIDYAFLAPKVSTDSPSKVGYGGAPLGSDFFNLSNGTVADLDYYYEPNVAQANYSDIEGYASANSGTKLMAAIGGWSYGPRWAQFAQDANYDVNSAPAQAFLTSVYNLLTGQLNSAYPVYDGVTIDWEFPGYRNNSPTLNAPQEGPFFQNLMIALRQKVDQAAAATGKSKVLVAALPASVKKMTATSSGQAPYGIDWTQLHGIFDWVDLMAFDMHGEFDAADSSLMTSMDQAPAQEIIPAINFLEAQGFQSKQIVLGIPTYTREQMVNTQPNSGNNYAYGLTGDMNPANIPGLNVYTPDTSFNDAPNVSPYYPVGGMVDNTGVYSYACMVGVSYCAAPTTLAATTDNRGLFGQPLPADLQKVTIADTSGNNIPHAWAYSSTLGSVVQSPAFGKNVAINSANKINGYEVFSYDTPATVTAKAINIVQKMGLGGEWFWDIANDTYKTADFNTSLYNAATATLGTNTQPHSTPTPPPSSTGLQINFVNQGSSAVIPTLVTGQYYAFPAVSPNGGSASWCDSTAAAASGGSCPDSWDIDQIYKGSAVSVVIQINGSTAWDCGGLQHQYTLTPGVHTITYNDNTQSCTVN